MIHEFIEAIFVVHAECCLLDDVLEEKSFPVLL